MRAYSCSTAASLPPLSPILRARPPTAATASGQHSRWRSRRTGTHRCHPAAVLGTWPSSSSAPPDPISHRSGGHRPAGTRQIGAVTGWWWGPSSCCSTAASSPPRSPDPRARSPATAAAPHTKGWPRNQSNQFSLQKFLDSHYQ